MINLKKYFMACISNFFFFIETMRLSTSQTSILST